MNEHVQTATSAPLFNPLSPEFIRNPYPHYERMRATDPMHLTPLGVYVASRHADVSLVVRDKRFGDAMKIVHLNRADFKPGRAAEAVMEDDG